MKMHLAELLEEEMRERGWNMTQLVMNMGPHESEEAWGICMLSWEMFFELRDNRNVVLGGPMAEQLEDAFDIPAQFFTNFHEDWRKDTH